MADGSDGRNNTSHRQCCPIKHKQHDFPCVISFKQTNPHSFPERQASRTKEVLPAQLFSGHNLPPFRQQIAWSGASARPVSSDNSMSDGHQYICRKGLSMPVAMIYSKTLTADLHGKCLPDSTDSMQNLCFFRMFFLTFFSCMSFFL